MCVCVLVVLVVLFRLLRCFLLSRVLTNDFPGFFSMVYYFDRQDHLEKSVTVKVKKVCRLSLSSLDRLFVTRVRSPWKTVLVTSTN